MGRDKMPVLAQREEKPSGGLLLLSRFRRPAADFAANGRIVRRVAELAPQLGLPALIVCQLALMRFILLPLGFETEAQNAVCFSVVWRNRNRAAGLLFARSRLSEPQRMARPRNERWDQLRLDFQQLIHDR